MSKDPFAAPGSEFLTGMNPVPSSKEKEIFRAKSPIRGGSAPRKPTSSQSVQDDAPEAYQPDTQPAEKKEEPHIRLHDLKWDRASARFKDKVKVSVRGDLPKSMEHLTRIVFTVSMENQDGKQQTVLTAEGHLRDGLAETEIDLPQTFDGSGKPLAEATMLCTAKHKNSKPTDHASLKVNAGKDNGDELLLEIEEGKEAIQAGWEFNLRNTSAQYNMKLEAKEAKNNNGALVFRFPDLPTSGKFTLELLGPDGKLLQNIFENLEYGTWAK